MTALDDSILQLEALLAKMAAGPDLNEPIQAGPAAINEQTKPKKEKKSKSSAQKPAPEHAASTSVPEDLTHFAKAKLVVSRVVSVEYLEGSDKLYKCQIDCGEEATRQVVAGLRKHVPLEEMHQRLVVTVLNLKPAKLANNMSEAMVLAGSSPEEDVVCPVLPPADSQPGDAVYLEAGEPYTAQPKTLKSAAWRAVVEKLTVEGGVAKHAGVPMVTSRGGLTLPENLPTGTIR